MNTRDCCGRRHAAAWLPGALGLLGLVFGVVLAGLPDPAQAMAVDGAKVPGTANPVSGALSVAEPGPRGQVSGTALPAPAVEWIVAAINAVNLARGELTLNGKPVVLHPTRLQVLDSDGRPVSAALLHAGQAIRFALDDGPAEARRIVLIRIDR